MPTNPLLRTLLALVMMVVGVIATIMGFNRYPLGFAAGCVLAVAGFMYLIGFGKRHPNR